MVPAKPPEVMATKSTKNAKKGRMPSQVFFAPSAPFVAKSLRHSVNENTTIPLFKMPSRGYRQGQAKPDSPKPDQCSEKPRMDTNTHESRGQNACGRSTETKHRLVMDSESPSGPLFHSCSFVSIRGSIEWFRLSHLK